MAPDYSGAYGIQVLFRDTHNEQIAVIRRSIDSLVDINSIASPKFAEQ